MLKAARRICKDLVGQVSHLPAWVSKLATSPTRAQRPAPRRPTAQIVAEILGIQSVTVINVGARAGVGAAWYRMHPLAKLIGFEPDAEECARLNGQVASAEEESYIAAALGQYAGPARFHATVDPMCSSLLQPDAGLADRYPVLEAMREVGVGHVQLTTLADWVSGEGVHDVSFLKLDTQGSELAILQGAGPLLDDCLGIEVEVEFSPLYLGQSLFAEVDAYLRERAFVLWRLDSLTHYSEHPSAQRLDRRGQAYYDRQRVTFPTGAGRLMWGNALYFRDYRTLAERRPLLVLAALLNAAGDDDAARGSLQRSLTLFPEMGQAERKLLSNHLATLQGDTQGRSHGNR